MLRNSVEAMRGVVKACLFSEDGLGFIYIPAQFIGRSFNSGTLSKGSVNTLIVTLSIKANYDH